MTPQKTSGRERAATLAGTAVRRIGLSFPGIVGPLAVCAGLWMLLPALGVIALGVILWAFDRRVP